MQSLIFSRVTNRLPWQSLWMMSLVLAMACSTDKKNTTPPAPVKNDLPALPIQQADGKQLMVNTLSGKAILVLFQPDCDHCQREAVQIRENVEKFKGYTLYFISNAPMEQLVKFSKDYVLDQKENIVFAHTELQYLLNSFGPIPAPSLYIYGDGGQLIKSFNGETPIETILKSI